MYIGDTQSRGLRHLFKEIIDNAINEAVAGHCTDIAVVYGKDHSLAVADNGRGIPVEVVPELGKSVVELVFTDFYAGRKFARRDNKITGGLHGAGTMPVNALSTWLDCEVRHNGSIYRQRFERGIPVNPLQIVGDCGKSEHGTKVTWLADDTIFTKALDSSGYPDYDAALLRERIRELAYLHKQVTFSFQDHNAGGAVETYHYPHGVANYVSHLNTGKEPLHPQVFSVEDDDENVHVEVALQYTKDDPGTIRSYVNDLYAWNGGTHVAGFRTALTRTLNRYGRENGFISANVSGNMFLVGLTAVVAVRLPNPSWAGGTRDYLVTRAVRNSVDRVVGKGLATFLKGKPQVVQAILGHTVKAAVQQ